MEGLNSSSSVLGHAKLRRLTPKKSLCGFLLFLNSCSLSCSFSQAVPLNVYLYVPSWAGYSQCFDSGIWCVLECRCTYVGRGCICMLACYLIFLFSDILQSTICGGGIYTNYGPDDWFGAVHAAEQKRFFYLARTVRLLDVFLSCHLYQGFSVFCCLWPPFFSRVFFI